jgi:hypothetical protein
MIRIHTPASDSRHSASETPGSGSMCRKMRSSGPRRGALLELLEGQAPLGVGVHHGLGRQVRGVAAELADDRGAEGALVVGADPVEVDAEDELIGAAHAVLPRRSRTMPLPRSSRCAAGDPGARAATSPTTRTRVSGHPSRDRGASHAAARARSRTTPRRPGEGRRGAAHPGRAQADAQGRRGLARAGPRPRRDGRRAREDEGQRRARGDAGLRARQGAPAHGGARHRPDPAAPRARSPAARGALSVFEGRPS